MQMNITAMIPARVGSERLKLKNLALLNGRPMISYAIEAAKASGVFDRIVVNSDGEVFQRVAQRYGVDFNLEPEHLGAAKSDDVVYDFLLHNPCDLIAWVNPISPLQSGDEIRDVVNYFVQEELDSLITVKNEQVHCVYQGEAINFSLEGLFAKTQELIPVQSFVYSVMMWRTQTFLEAFDKQGYALLCGKLGYYPVSKASSVIIKTAEDLALADSILKSREGRQSSEVLYDDLVAVE